MATSRPILLVFCLDLMAYSRIEGAARQVGFDIQMADFVTSVQDTVPATIPYTERLSGPGADLIDRISAMRPALILFDLGAVQIPWRQWLPLLKSAPATRRIPVVCYGSHIDTEALKRAQSSGADAVLPRSAFFTNLLDVIQKYARVTDYAALKATCQQPLSASALHGLDLFNRGEYFEAHEVRSRAILQVAVAYLQIERHNYNGAVKMFLRLRQWIEPFPEVCRGIEIGKLRLDARRVYERLLELGPQQMDQFDRSLFAPVRYRQPKTNSHG
jgi:CheY-like chemotaxis protein